MRLKCTFVVWVGTLLASHCVHAESPDQPELGNSAVELGEVLREIVLAHLPHEYEDRSDWGGTKEVWNGLQVSLDGLRIKTKRRKKVVKHGTWKRYRAWLMDPEDGVVIVISGMQKAEQGGVAFDVTVQAELGAFGRLSEWRRDVQLISLGVDAEARVTLRLTCESHLSLDHSNWPPDLLIDPVVTNAALSLDDFRLIRVSNLSGPLIKQLGKALKKVLQREFDKRQPKLRTKVNEEIDKHRDQLRLSVHELLYWDEVSELLKDSGIEVESDPKKATN